MYAQRYYSPEEAERNRMITTDDYQAGVSMGWKLAFAYLGFNSEEE